MDAIDSRASEPLNMVVHASGRISPVCQYCGRQGRAVVVDPDRGQPGLTTIAHDWWVAPFRKDYVHPDGSRGSTFTCPACSAEMSSGKSLRRMPERGSASRNAAP